MRYLLALLVPAAFIVGASCDPVVTEPTTPTVSTPTIQTEETWAEDSLPKPLLDEFDAHADEDLADLLPVGEVDGHKHCWSATSTDTALIMCPDGFVQRLTRG